MEFKIICVLAKPQASVQHMQILLFVAVSARAAKNTFQFTRYGSLDHGLELATFAGLIKYRFRVAK